MPKKSEERFHQKTYHHIRRHRKKYSRFILFTVVLSAFRIAEDYFLIKSIGLEIEIDIFILFSIIFVAFLFTVIAEITEKMIEKEESQIKRIIRKKIKNNI